jgi:hypothetical protein
MQHEQQAANGPHFSVTVHDGPVEYTALAGCAPGGVQPRGVVMKRHSTGEISMLWLGKPKADEADAFDQACRWMSDWLVHTVGVR